LGWALLLRLRRPGDPLLPWCVLLAVGAIAATPMAHLRPTVVTILFLPLLLHLLSGPEQLWDSWKRPLRVGLLLMIWVNVDPLWIIGLFTITLLAVGEVLNRFLLRGVTSDAGSEPVPIRGIFRALLLALMVPLTNPTFVGALTRSPSSAVAQLLPAELGYGLPAEALDDPDLFRWALTPLSNEYLSSVNFGQSPAGIAGAVLAALSLVTLAFSAKRLRATPILLWVGFAWLALQNYRLIAPFAMVAAALTAWHWNAFGRHLTLGTPIANLLGSLSGVARIVSFTGLLIGLLAAWPGWLHTVPTDRAYALRVHWGIEPDAGLVRTAGELERLHKQQPEAQFFAMSVDVADAMAWFAPNTPQPFNSRLRLYRGETLQDFVNLRRALGIRRTANNDPARLEEFFQLCGKFGADAVVFGASNRRLDLSGPLTLALDGESPRPVLSLDGRSAILGITDRFGRTTTVDPIRLAFGPAVEPIPAIEAIRPASLEEPPLLELWYERPKVAALDTDDALIWSGYAEEVGRNADRAYMQGVTLGRAAAFGLAVTGFIPPPTPPIRPERSAWQMVIVRAARRAIAKNPERFEPYQALLYAWMNPATPGLDAEERRLLSTTARNQLLDRLPDGETATIAQIATAAEQGRMQALNYAQLNQFDLARTAGQKAMRAAKVIQRIAPGALRGSQPPAKDETPAAGFIKELDALIDQITREVSRRNDELGRRLGNGSVPPAQKFRLSVELGLPGAALEQFQETKAEEFGADAGMVALQTVNLLIRAGRIEEAATYLKELKLRVEEAGAASAGPALDEFRSQLTSTGILMQRILGNAEATSIELTQQAAGRFVPLQPAERAMLRELEPVFAIEPAAFTRGISVVAGFPAVIAFAPKLELASRYQGRLLEESDFFTTLGILAMYAGKNEEAATRFQQALRPQGEPLSAVGAVARAEEIEGLAQLLRLGGIR
jgi:hypothetical protein